MKNDCRYNKPFYKAIRKYGKDNLKWEIIDTADSEQNLNDKEIYWIKHYNSFMKNKDSNGYNLTFGGEGVNGLILSQDSKNKIRESELGENNTRARLNNHQVLQIVELSKNNTHTQVELSKLYNTSEATISRIISGMRWSSVTGIIYNG